MNKLSIGDEVKVVGGCPGSLSIYLGRTGVIEKIKGERWPYRIKGFTNINGHYAVWSEDELELVKEEAKEIMEFKVDDKVTVVKSRDLGNSHKSIGKTGIVQRVDDDSTPYRVHFDELNDYWYYRRDELVLAKSTIEPKDVLRLLLEGKDIRHSAMSQGRYMRFTNGTIKYNDGGYCDVTVWIAKDGGEFEEYVEPESPPKFSKDSLVYNTDGTIGKVVEDKGLFKGTRKYAVKFNAVREALRTVGESELSAYES